MYQPARDSPFMKKYNIREKKDKNSRYRERLKAGLVDELYGKILHRIVIEKKYRDPDYSAKALAQDLGTNTRYISAVIGLRFNDNYTGLVNEYRIKDACYLLKDSRYSELTMEDIGLMAGYSRRQSFYVAFYRKTGKSPLAYRRECMERKKQEKNTLEE